MKRSTRNWIAAVIVWAAFLFSVWFFSPSDMTTEEVRQITGELKNLHGIDQVAMGGIDDIGFTFYLSEPLNQISSKKVCKIIWTREKFTSWFTYAVGDSDQLEEFDCFERFPELHPNKQN